MGGGCRHVSGFYAAAFDEMGMEGVDAGSRPG